MESESECESIRVLIKQYKLLRNVRWQHDNQLNCLNKNINVGFEGFDIQYH